MDVQLLEDIGLTNAQAHAYKALIEKGTSSAPVIAKMINESRSNTYKVLDRLCELGLATKDNTGKKVQYFPTSPTALEQLVHDQAAQVSLRERKLSAAMPDMLSYFFAHSEQAGIRFFQGKEGIQGIYRQQIRDGKPIVYIRTRAEIDLLGFTYTHNMRNLIPKAGIRRHAFTPDSPEVSVNWQESDKRHLLTRTWYEPQDYTAPVEWSVFGNKVAAISFGKEAIGMIIESPQIADSFRQIFALLDEGLRRRKDYASLPRRAEYNGLGSFVKKYQDSVPKL